MRTRKMDGMLLMIAAVMPAVLSWAEIKMGTPFTDHAVLQRNMKVPVWGTAKPGSKIALAFAGQNVSTTVPESGKWRVDLSPMEASKESRSMTVVETVSDSGKEIGRVEIKDILVGEVWLASGQSNMDFHIWGRNPRFRDHEGALVVASTFLQNVRFASVSRAWSVEPQKQHTPWEIFNPKSILSGHELSAIAFYYARELYLALDVPVGIVSAAWGGTNIDAWTPRSAYEGCSEALRPTAEYQVRKDWQKKLHAKGVINRAENQPTVLWNGMISAWAPMAARGFLWYQGCSNASEAHLYCEKMHALYKGWSTKFENPNFKLYFVQLAPYTSNWMGIVEAQNKFAAEEKNAAIAVSADIGNFADIHPNKKRSLAQRLLIHALKNDYGFDIKRSDSPVFKRVKFEGKRAVLSFDNVSSWYIYADNRSLLAPFELAGEDGVWHHARVVNAKHDGRIEGVELLLESDKVENPKKVRYMGKNKTMGTVYNELSLPLGPFQSR